MLVLAVLLEASGPVSVGAAQALNLRKSLGPRVWAGHHCGWNPGQGIWGSCPSILLL